jgi:hypothetical protein
MTRGVFDSTLKRKAKTQQKIINISSNTMANSKKFIYYSKPEAKWSPVLKKGKEKNLVRSNFLNKPTNMVP